MSDATMLATELARAIYRLTDALPGAEPLRMKLRERALEVASSSSREALYAIDAMLALLYVAEVQRFAREENFTLLKREYEKLRGLQQENDATPFFVHESHNLTSHKEGGGNGSDEKLLRALNPRQKKIMQHFHYRHVFQLREARALFEGYSQKTLRNDLRDLCLKGILNREGVGTTSFYRVVIKSA